MYGNFLTIPQAAEMLQVTTKTIRNYIKRSFLQPEMWNGAWRIPRNQILEIFEKKFGKRCSGGNAPSPLYAQDVVAVSNREYADLQQRAGRLEMIEKTAAAQRDEAKAFQERIAQLEATSASAWTEARACKAQNDELNGQLSRVNEENQKLREEAGWLRREVDRLNEETGGLREDLKRRDREIAVLVKRTAELASQAHLRAVGV